MTSLKILNFAITILKTMITSQGQRKFFLFLLQNG